MQGIKNFVFTYRWCILYVGLAVVLFFFMAFRSMEVGTDTLTYSDIFQRIEIGDIGVFNNLVEPGFSLYCLIIAKLGLRYIGFQIISSIILVTIFCLAIYKMCNDKFYGLFIYVFSGVYFVQFNGVRQALAIAILLCGILLLRKKQKWLWLIPFILFAATIHKSSLLYLFAIILFYIKLDWKKTLCIFCVCGIMMFFAKDIFMFLYNTFDITYLEKYINTGYFNETVSFKSICLSLFYILVLVAGFVYINVQKIKLGKDRWMFNFFIVATLFRFLTLFGCFPFLIMRLFDAFYWVVIFLIPSILKNINNVETKKYGKIVIDCVLLAMFSIQYVLFQNANIFPYTFIF